MTEQLQTDTQADRRKRKFSFFASALLKRKLQPHIWHIAFCPPTHKPDRWAKVKEPNFTDTQSMQ